MTSSPWNEPDKDLEDPKIFLDEFHRYVKGLVDRNVVLIELHEPEVAAAAYKECVRDVIDCFHDAGIIKDYDPGDVMTIAAQASYVCRMFLVAFDEAYTSISTRRSNVQSLEDKFKL